MVAISTIIGDIVHNLRSAPDSPASEMAVRHVGRPLKDRLADAMAGLDVCSRVSRGDE